MMTNPGGYFARRLSFETGHATHVGHCRERNEDNYLVLPESGLWAVADGMGGHAGGDVASTTIIDALRSIGAPASAPDLLSQIEDRLLQANADVLRFAGESGAGTVGSTVVALLIFGVHYACVWSGDSRLYRIRRKTIEQISRDHTEAQDLIEQGILTEQEASNWPRRNVLTRALGVFETPELDLDQGLVENGDVFVLCTDGLTAHLDSADIVATVDRGTAQEACNILIAQALERGGTDNVTAVMVRVAETTSAQVGMSP